VGKIAPPGGYATASTGAGQRLVQGGANLCIFQHVRRPGSTRIRDWIRKRLGVDQIKALQSIVFMARAAAPILPGWLV